MQTFDELPEISQETVPLKREPLVSVIISNYNYARFLPDAINSVLAQDYTRLELIVVDDGSTDNSREVILGYEERIIPLLKENGGQASAFNAGFERSQGEIVIFLDADDMLLPGTVRQVAQVFKANPQIAKIEYRMEVMDKENKPTGNIKPAPHLSLPAGDLRRQILNFPYDLTWMATSGNAFSSQVLQQIFPVPEKVYGRVGADWYISHLTPLFGLVVFLKEVGAYYRVHEANNYESTSINLSWVRQTIKYMQITSTYIEKFSTQLGLKPRPGQILSVSFIANRLISLKLDPRNHPLPEDRGWRLLLDGIAASLRRFDVSLSLKMMFLFWFTAMWLAPKPLACWLAEQFFFPEQRKNRFNKLLGLLHRVH